MEEEFFMSDWLFLQELLILKARNIEKFINYNYPFLTSFVIYQ